MENYDTQDIRKKADDLVQTYLEMCKLCDIADMKGRGEITLECELLEVVPEAVYQLRRKIEAWCVENAPEITK